MNKRLFLFAFMVVLGYTGCAQKANNHEVAIAFYNCENFFDTKHDAGKEDEEFTPEGKYHYTERIYAQKQHNIATAIQKMGNDDTPDGPALIGLAEVENNTVLDDLVRQPEIAAHHYKYEWYNGPDQRGINVALLYNPAYFHVLRSEPLHVSLAGIGGKENTRDVLYVCGILAGDTVHVFVNHWPSRRDGEDESAPKRAAAATVVKNKIDALMRANPKTKAIIMGDLNDNPTDASVTQVLSAKGAKNEVQQTGLYDPWADIYNSGIGTEEYKHHWNLFDQIIISGAFLQNHKLHFDKAEIFKPDFLIDHYGRSEGYPHRSFAGTHWINGYSDHFPVIMYLIK